MAYPLFNRRRISFAEDVTKNEDGEGWTIMWMYLMSQKHTTGVFHWLENVVSKGVPLDGMEAPSVG